MKRIGFIVVFLLFVQTLPVYCEADVTTPQTNLVFDRPVLIFTENEEISFMMVGYDSRSPDSDTTAEINVIEGGTGNSYTVETRTMSGAGLHHVNLGKFDIGNASSRSYQIFVVFTFFDGHGSTERKNINVLKKPDWYSAHFTENGEEFYWFSHEPFTVEFIYSYGYGIEPNSSVFDNVDGVQTYKIPPYRGLMSVEVWVTDRWNNTNSREGKNEYGMRVPIFHPYYEIDKPTFWEKSGTAALLILIGVITVFVIVFIWQRRQE